MKRIGAIRKTLDLLKAQWKTYASVSIASPRVLLRAIVLDALLANAESDDMTKSALAMLLASALPHLSVGKEGQVWKTALDDLLGAVERKAEVAWMVPSQISIPAFPELNVPTSRVTLKSAEVDSQALEKAMFAAAGPNNAQGRSTNGNSHWPSQGQYWSQEFAPLAASAISKAISDASGAKTASVNTRPLANALISGIVNYLETVVGHMASTTHGVEIRSRLLWWKEALMSPSTRLSYRDVDCKAAPGLMAYDYHVMLPALAPASVSAFLLETVRTLHPDDETASLLEWLQAFAALTDTHALTETIHGIAFADGYRPMVSLVTLGEPDVKSIEEVTVFTPSLSLTAGQFSLLVFLELQAMKATKEVVPFAAEEHSESNGDDTDSGK